MKGWVYVITNPSIPGTKVGFSTKDPELRAQELSSTGVPYPYVVEYDVLVENPQKYEQAAHRRLEQEGHREAKEWFKCTPEEAVVAIKAVIGDDKIIIESYKRLERAKAEELQRQQLQEKELREKQEAELRRASKAEQERAEHLQYLRRKEEAEEAELRRIRAQEKEEKSRRENGTQFQEELEKVRKEEKIRREEEERKIARQYLERKETLPATGKSGINSVGTVTGSGSQPVENKKKKDYSAFIMIMSLSLFGFVTMLIKQCSVESEMPPNAHSLSRKTGTFSYRVYWECDAGYRREGDKCEEIPCNRKIGNKCMDDYDNTMRQINNSDNLKRFNR